MGILFQVIATVLLCFSCMNMGLFYTWPSSTILLFTSENTTLHRPMGAVETALFGSLPAIGSMVVHPVAGILLDKFGRKRTTLLTSLIFVISWSLIALSNRVEAILAAALISGFGYASFIVVTIYISEISQDSIRGTLTSGPNQFSGFGILASYFLGGVLGYHEMVYTYLTLTVIGVLLILVLKESPVSLMAEGREEVNIFFLNYLLYRFDDLAWWMSIKSGALVGGSSLCVGGISHLVPPQYYVGDNTPLATTSGIYRRGSRVLSILSTRRTTSTSKEVVTELNNIRRTLKSNSEGARSLTRTEADVDSQFDAKKISCWQFFRTTPSTRRQFYLVMVLKTAFICQGLPVVQVYAEPMFAAAVGDVISPNLCSVVLGLVVLIAGVIASYLTDVVGRRPLQISSSIVTGICCAVLGTQIVTELLPKWTIPLLIYIFATSHTVGSGTVPFVVAAEVFVPEVKSILLMIAVEWAWICNFCFLFLFNILVQAVGLAPVFYFFSFVCFVTSVYFFYFLPETKGLPVYAIQALFKKNTEE